MPAMGVPGSTGELDIYLLTLKVVGGVRDIFFVRKISAFPDFFDF